MPPRRLPTDSSDYARWLADAIERRPEWSFWITHETAAFVGMALRGYAERLDERSALKLQYVTTVYSDYSPQGDIVAAASRTASAWAAFQASIPEFPHARTVILHQGARVLGRHPPHASGNVAAPESNVRISEKEMVASFVETARATYFLGECAIEIADPPVVERTDKGVRVLAWLPVVGMDLPS